VTAAYEAAPDIQRLVEGIDASFIELREAVAARAPAKAAVAGARRPRAKRAYGAR
jgi:hypothetical protein